MLGKRIGFYCCCFGCLSGFTETGPPSVCEPRLARLVAIPLLKAAVLDYNIVVNYLRWKMAVWITLSCCSVQLRSTKRSDFK